jgi:hypothetical protein
MTKGTYHLECPNPSDPDLELALHTLDIFDLHALPPTSACWFPPEKQELLCHAYRIAVEFVAPNISA